MQRHGKSALREWYAIRWQILERDNFTCQYCGQAAPNVFLEVDHKIPVSDGGSDNPDNLVASCSACNRGKNAFITSFKLRKKRVAKLFTTSTETTASRIVKLLREAKEGLTRQQLVSNLGLKLDTVKKSLHRLEDRQLVVNCQGRRFLNKALCDKET